MVNLDDIHPSLSEDEIKLQKALLVFYNSFHEPELYCSEDGLFYSLLKEEKGFVYHLEQHEKQIDLTRIVQFSEAAQEMKHAFPNKDDLQQASRENLMALFEFYKSSTQSYISCTTPSLPVTTEVIPGGEGKVLDLHELIRLCIERDRNGTLSLESGHVKFIPLHLLRQSFQRLQLSLKEIKIDNIQTEEINADMTSLLSKNFDESYRSAIQHAHNVKKYTNANFYIDAFKLSRPLWNALAIDLFCKAISMLEKKDQEETILILFIVLPLLLVLLIIPLPPSSSLLNQLMYIVYLYSLSRSITQTLTFTSFARIILGMHIEMEVLSEHYSAIANSADLKVVTSLLNELDRHDALSKTRDYDDLTETYFDCYEDREESDAEFFDAKTPEEDFKPKMKIQ